MQNSGLGNIVNPLMSLADKEIYSIPMLMMIGWRGEPGVKDEPQHIKQGRVMIDTLNVMEIPHYTISEDTSEKELSDILKKSIDETIKNLAINYDQIHLEKERERFKLATYEPGLIDK